MISSSIEYTIYFLFFTLCYSQSPTDWSGLGDTRSVTALDSDGLRCFWQLQAAGICEFQFLFWDHSNVHFAPRTFKEGIC